MTHFALTIIGRDRTGIVSQATEILYRLGCNIADSRSMLLGGQFTMTLIISNPAIKEKADFGDVFAPLEESGLSVFIRTLKPGGETRLKLEGDICMISVYGADKPGIVYRVARELSDRRVNIVDLHTERIGSETRPVYVMILEVVLPDDLDETKLNEIMNHVKEELNVDISIRSITPVEL
jgi:glycine cleavage system transcriptional repressor